MNISSNSGTFEGSQFNDDVLEFLGIQYATAQRFAEPVDIVDYAEVVNATSFGPQSPQVPNEVAFTISGYLTMSTGSAKRCAVAY